MKLQLNVYSRLLLSGMVSQYKEGQQLSMRENLSFESLVRSLTFTEDEMIKYEIKENNEKMLAWNKHGVELHEINVHPLAVTGLITSMISKLEGKIDSTLMAVIRQLMTDIVNSDERDTLERESLEKLEKKREEIEELYKEFGLSE